MFESTLVKMSNCWKSHAAAHFIQFIVIMAIAYLTHNSFLASGKFCHLLITFSNRLDPDQDRQNDGPVISGSKLFDANSIQRFF